MVAEAEAAAGRVTPPSGPTRKREPPALRPVVVDRVPGELSGRVNGSLAGSLQLSTTLPARTSSTRTSTGPAAANS